MPESMSLSLSPRYDLFRVMFDKTFLTKEVTDKYQSVIDRHSNIIITPIDYLNESIQGFHLPGLSELIIDQQQHGHNGHNGVRTREHGKGQGVEPSKAQHYISPANTLSLIEDVITITFRMNVGLYNYFMLYETLLSKQSKAPAIQPDDDLIIFLLNELGEVVCKITLRDIMVEGLDGLDLNYSRAERQSETFDLRLKFNDISFDFVNIN